MLNRFKGIPFKLRLSLVILAVFLFIFILIPIPKIDSTPTGTVILDKEGEILRIFTNEDEQFLYALNSNTEIPLKVKSCILNFEDQHFYKHPGVNPSALIRAIKLNHQFGKIISGGSTITMQVIGILRPRSRTYINKAIEILSALKFDLFYKKDTILKLYCNNAPYGSNIIGIRTASYKYFRKDLTRLTWAESALLAVLPNAPGAIFPGSNQDELKRKRDRLLTTLQDRGLLSKEVLQSSLREPLPQRIHSFPFHAPHLGRKLHNSEQGKTWATTIDRKLQSQIEFLSRNLKNNFINKGIKNYSILVTERKTGAVRVYLGSQDFRDNSRQGQIDGVQAARSTGSVLKPFLYAGAIDEGLILPQTLLPDKKVYYGLFSPENYDFKYRGIVTAEEALRRSLNVPAANLLEQYGTYRFCNLFREGGLTTLFRAPEEYGLSLVIGGAEATLWEVSKLYLELANLGTSPTIHTIDSKNKSSCSLPLSKSACWMTLEMLKNNNFTPYELAGKKPIAVKTGTSFGFRDAWAVGVSSDWIVSVWTGNFTGESNPGIVSFTAAVPILKSVYSTLPSLDEQNWFYAPEANLRKQLICSETGYYPGPDCPETIEIMIPITAKPLRTCPYHVTRIKDIESKASVCSKCWEGMETEKETFLEFPPSITQIINNQNAGYNLAPTHNPDCPVANSYLKPEIIYPINGSNLILPLDFGNKRQSLILRAEHSQADITLFWYLDKSSVGETKGIHTLTIEPDSGSHTLEVVDSNGSSSSVRFTIKQSIRL